MAIGDQDLRFRVLAQVVGQQAVDGLRTSFDRLNSTGNILRNGLKLLAGAFAAREAIQFGKELIDTADNLRDLSIQTGISVRDLSGFKTAAEQSGTSLENLTKSFRKLAVNAVDASKSNREIASVFKTLGVSVTDASGTLRPTGDLVKDIADKFATLSDGPEKSAIALKLFGKSGAELIPLLNQGSESLTKFGVAFSDDFADRADQFNDAINTLGVELKNVFVGGLSELLPTLQDVLNAFTNLPGSADGVNVVFEAIGETVRLLAVAFNGLGTALVDLADIVSNYAKRIGVDFARGFEQAGDSVETLGRRLKALVTGDFDGFERAGAQYAKRTADRFNLASSETDALAEGLQKRREDRLKAFQSRQDALLRNSRVFGQGSLDEIRAREQSDTQAAPRRTSNVRPSLAGLDTEGTRERDRIREFIQQQKLENDQRREALGDINKTQLEIAKLNEARKFEIEVLRQNRGLTREQREELKRLSDDVINQRLQLVELDFQQRRTWQFGAREALREYVDNATNSARQVAQVFNTAFSSLENTLVDFVKSGQLNFKQFADAVITELIRIAVRQAVIAPIAGSLLDAFSFSGSAGVSGAGAGAATASAGPSTLSAFADGGIMTGLGPLPLKRYARGGVATSPQLALYGEGSRPEAFVPLPDGRRIPVSMQGGSGGTNVNVTVNMGSNDQASASTDNGVRFGNVIASVVREEIINQQRPGGLLA